jgi:hypothetical protein
MDFRGIGWGGMDWINLTEDREHGNEPSSSIKYWDFLEWLNKWRLLKKASVPLS